MKQFKARRNTSKMENLLIGDILTETPSSAEHNGADSSQPEQNQKAQPSAGNVGVLQHQNQNHYVRFCATTSRSFMCMKCPPLHC